MSCTKGEKEGIHFWFLWAKPNSPHSNVFFSKNLEGGGSSFITRYTGQMPSLVDLKTGTPSEN